jgi:predicted DNA-binding protein (MmcQ/YjbR family)/RimJ/RimL family protein N-acetyltransferase
VIDLDRGWPTERLDLEPLTATHAAELAPLLDDPALHEFTGGAPLSEAALAARYARLAVRRSPDGKQIWGNWVIRIRATGAAAGTVQATLPAGGPAAGPAEVAWVVVRAAQGHGYAKEAARSLVAVLRQEGWTVIAHIHPGHVASQQVARAAGLSPTTHVRDGETRWACQAARLDWVIAACRAERGAAEDYPFGDGVAVFKVSGRMFALVPLGEKPGSVSLKCDPELAVVLRGRYAGITPGYHLSKRHWNTVTLDGSVPDEEVLELIRHSYDLVVAKLTRAQRDQLASPG